ncbi:zinc finger BED domain-containing protein RICESLEEPER 2-like [Rhizophagus irregularis DAOM 181602=DAOM 197198]|nr:zinc finger BED domain-containing protein RICESLEEPER 2-like [Rhizophagus irregularis DAOM 181602=DAOM 197198]
MAEFDPSFIIPGEKKIRTMSSRAKHGYLGVTATWITSKFEIKDTMLENKYVPSPHTSNIIANELHKCIETWNLGNQVTSITMDNGSNMDAITQLQADLFTSTDREIKKDENRLKRLLLTNDEWELLDQLVDLLMPFEEATREFSGNSYITLS